jgi:hypothetical protein
MQIRNKAELEEAILSLEKKRIEQEQELVTQFHATVDSLKPANLIKGAFNKMVGSPEGREGLLKTATGLGAGLLANKFLLGRSSSMIGKIASNLLKVTVAKTAASNADKLKAYGTAIYHNLFQKKSNHTEH